MFFSFLFPLTGRIDSLFCLAVGIPASANLVNLLDGEETVIIAGETIPTLEGALDLLAGSQLDFVEDLIGAAFQVNNPNATSSCGCGASFSV